MKKWNLVWAGVAGALVGVVVSVVGPMVTGGAMPSDPTELLGNLGAGALIFAVGGVVVAVIRNATVKAG